MTNYQKGRAFEYRIMHDLEEVGYSVQRSAGSHGLYDVIAWNESHFRLIQAKVGKGITTDERNKIKDNKVPVNCIKEIWHKTDRGTQIERL